MAVWPERDTNHNVVKGRSVAVFVKYRINSHACTASQNNSLALDDEQILYIILINRLINFVVPYE